MKFFLLNRRNRIAVLSIAIFYLLMQISCSNLDMQATASTVSELTPSATTLVATQSQSVSSTSTAIESVAAPSITIPTPELPSFLEEDFPLAGSSNCNLPCWHSLIAGESNLQDVQRVFQSVLGFDKTVDILELPRPDVYFSPLPFQDELLVVQAWGLDGTGPYREISFRFDKQTTILQQISFYFMGDTNLSPSRVIRDLGTPSYVLVSARQTETASQRSASVVLVYEEGIVIVYPGVVPAERTDSGKWVAEFCMANFSIPSSLTIARPLLALTDLNIETIERDDDRDLNPIQEEFSISVDEFAQRVLQEDSPCLYTEVES